jgi:hypothetical protein
VGVSGGFPSMWIGGTMEDAETKKARSVFRYWTGPVERDERFSAVWVYCLEVQGYRFHHSGRLKIADLPDWDWYDISAHLKCTECGAVGWVDVRLGFRFNPFRAHQS